jgi:hypothetical protein
MVAYLVVDFEVSDEADYRGLAQVVRPLLAQHGGAIRAFTQRCTAGTGFPRRSSAPRSGATTGSSWGTGTWGSSAPNAGGR